MYHIKGDTPQEITGFQTDPFTLTKTIHLTPGEGEKKIQMFLDHGTEAFVYDPIIIVLDTTAPTPASNLTLQTDTNSYLF